MPHSTGRRAAAVCASFSALLSAPAAWAGGTSYLVHDELVVEQDVTFDYVYVVGEAGMVVGDVLRVHEPVVGGVRVGPLSVAADDPIDCASPSYGHHGLVTVSNTGAATVGFQFFVGDPVTFNGHNEGYAEVVIESGELVEGDEIVIRFGDSDVNPDCGYRVPPRAYRDLQWLADETLANEGLIQAPVATVPSFDFVAEREGGILVATAPSVVAVGEPVVLQVAVLDRYGNPATEWEGVIDIDAAFGGAHADLGLAAEGRWEFPIDLPTEGVYRIDVTADGIGGALSARSNPIVVQAEAPDRVFWGDIHVHHGNVFEDELGNRVNENLWYARDYYGIDVTCESMKIPFQADWNYERDGDLLWEGQQEDCVAYSDDDFLTLLGFEWVGWGTSGNHHNVYYDHCNGETSIQQSVLSELFEFTHEQDALWGGRSVVVPHATYTEWEWETQDDSLRTAAEVFSGGWVNSVDGEYGTLDGTVIDAMRHGLRLGFFASSDNHDGFLGNPSSEAHRYVNPGLAAFVVPELSHEEVIASLAERRTYASTGTRTVMTFHSEENGAEFPMGGEHLAQVPTFRWTAHADHAVIDVKLRGVYTELGEEPFEIMSGTVESLDFEGEFTWEGFEHREAAVWLEIHEEGEHVVWSSPIWLTATCGPTIDDPAGVCDNDGDGSYDALFGGGDCDDEDPAIYDGAPEIPYDGVDANCDGWSDYDYDLDGFDSDLYGGTDCVDDDPQIYPGAVDAPYDGVDHDCDGWDDYDADRDGEPSDAFGGADCDDLRDDVYPGAVDVPYDGVDADCDGWSDDDADRDGYDAVAQGGADCDDTDAAVSPEAVEVYYDGLDADCDGASDYDADGDGFDSVDYGGDDCDDAAAAVFPGAPEVFYDGVDGDCDGASDYDLDGDGEDALAFGGADCDDANAAVYPSAEDLPYDGVDANCDGRSDYDADQDGQDAEEHGGTDCDDADAAVFAGAEDAPYDGVDADCDGWSDYDADRDGLDVIPHGEDCNDVDPTVGDGPCVAPVLKTGCGGCTTGGTGSLPLGALLGLAALARRRRR